MPFDADTGNVDKYGRVIWTCRGCGATTTREADIDPHVCERSDLGKTTSDDEADLVLAAVEKRMAEGMEVYALQSNLSMLVSMAKHADQQATRWGKERGAARSSREAGEVEGKVQAYNMQAEMFRVLANGVRGDLKRKGVDA